MIRSETIEEYIDELGDQTSTPGGGAAAAMSGAQAAALIEMVCHFTSDNTETIKPIFERSKQTKEAMLVFADQDIICFNALMASYKLPRSTEQQVKARTSTIQACLISAATVPLEMIKMTHTMIPDLLCLAHAGNKNLITDVGISASLAQSTLVSSRLNVLINLKQIRDETFQTDTMKHLDTLTTDLGSLQEIQEQISDDLHDAISARHRPK